MTNPRRAIKILLAPMAALALIPSVSHADAPDQDCSQDSAATSVAGAAEPIIRPRLDGNGRPLCGNVRMKGEREPVVLPSPAPAPTPPAPAPVPAPTPPTTRPAPHRPAPQPAPAPAPAPSRGLSSES